MPLYRALRDAEIVAGNVLVPKSQAPFRAYPRLPIVLPFTLGEREEYAVREHQWSGQYPTRGISCTTEWKVALRYAGCSKVIVTISEELCERHAIRRYRVRDHVPAELIVHPEDEEVILVSDAVVRCHRRSSSMSLAYDRKGQQGARANVPLGHASCYLKTFEMKQPHQNRHAARVAPEWAVAHL